MKLKFPGRAWVRLIDGVEVAEGQDGQNTVKRVGRALCRTLCRAPALSSEAC
ncbi:MAG: hypothetical protein H6559_17435 [Lewinellaceae bacterium]|nr:hypothetical protein [Lewinellaceae bacterium]